MPGSSILMGIGCPPGIRTPIGRVRVVSPTIEREGKKQVVTAAAGSAGATISRLCKCTRVWAVGQPRAVFGDIRDVWWCPVSVLSPARR